MPQKVICSECAHVLYESNIEINILRSPQDIARKYEGRCPSCRKILKFSFESVTFSAVNRATLCRLEWHFSVFATIRADDLGHFPRASVEIASSTITHIFHSLSFSYT
jgi:hypothetical protein